MKILKNKVCIQVTCPYCESELEVYEDDINVIHHFGHGMRINITCAACNQEIPLKREDLRSEWDDLLIDPDDDDVL